MASTYTFNGHVLDSSTGKLLPGLLVECWAVSGGDPYYVAGAVSDGQGAFLIVFDASVLASYLGGHNFYFRVFYGPTLLDETSSTPMVNLGGDTYDIAVPVTIAPEVGELPTFEPAEPAVAYKVNGFVAESAGDPGDLVVTVTETVETMPVLRATTRTDAKGNFSFTYVVVGEDERRDDGSALATVDIALANPGEEPFSTTEVDLLVGAPVVLLDVEVPPDAFAGATDSLSTIDAVLNLDKDADLTAASLESITLRTFRRDGVAAEYPELAAFVPYAEFDALSIAPALAKTLIEAGMETLDDLAGAAPTAIATAADLSVAEAVALRDSARLYTSARDARVTDIIAAVSSGYSEPETDGILTVEGGVRATHTALPGADTGCLTAPGPVAYLTALTELAGRTLKDGDQPASPADVAEALALPYHTLGTNCAVLDAAVLEARLVAERLVNYAATAPTATLAAYAREAAYPAILAALGTSYEELAGAPTLPLAARIRLADRLGLPGTRNLETYTLDPEQRTPSALYSHFGLLPLNGTPGPFGTPTLLTHRQEYLRRQWLVQDWGAVRRELVSFPASGREELAAPTAPAPVVPVSERPFAFADPVLIGSGDIQPRLPSGATNPVYGIWAERAQDRAAMRTNFAAVLPVGLDDPDVFTGLLDGNFGTPSGPPAGWPAAFTAYAAGATSDSFLATFDLAPADLAALAQAWKAISVNDDVEFEGAVRDRTLDVLVTVWSRQQTSGWRSEEKAAGITLSPDYFRLRPDTQRGALPDDAVLAQQRLTWERTLAGRTEQVASLESTLQEVLREAEQQALTTRLTTGSTVVVRLLQDAFPSRPENGETRADVARRRLFIEPDTAASVVTTRVAHATEALQALLRATRSGELSTFASDFPDFGLTPNVVTTQFDAEWTWLNSYDTWRAALSVALYPENVATPYLRKLRTPAYDTLLTALQDRSSSRTDLFEAAVADYGGYVDDLNGLVPRAACFAFEADPEARSGTDIPGYRRRLFSFGQATTSGALYWTATEAPSLPQGSIKEAASQVPLPAHPWQPVPDVPLNARVVGAAVYETENASSRYVCLLLQEGEAPAVRLYRYDLDQHLWVLNTEGGAGVIVSLPYSLPKAHVVLMPPAPASGGGFGDDLQTIPPPTPARPSDEGPGNLQEEPEEPGGGTEEGPEGAVITTNPLELMVHVPNQTKDLYHIALNPATKLIVQSLHINNNVDNVAEIVSAGRILGPIGGESYQKYGYYTLEKRIRNNSQNPQTLDTFAVLCFYFFRVYTQGTQTISRWFKHPQSLIPINEASTPSITTKRVLENPSYDYEMVVFYASGEQASSRAYQVKRPSSIGGFPATTDQGTGAVFAQPNVLASRAQSVLAGDQPVDVEAPKQIFLLSGPQTAPGFFSSTVDTSTRAVTIWQRLAPRLRASWRPPLTSDARSSRRIDVEASFAEAFLSTTAFYLEEAYFAFPLLAADALHRARRYDDELLWLRAIYDDGASGVDRYVYTPLSGGAYAPLTSRTLPILSDPLDPFERMRTVPGSALRHVLLGLSRALIGAADAEFALDTPEAVSRARSYYDRSSRVLNHEVLGRIRPRVALSLEALDTLVPGGSSEAPEEWAAAVAALRADVEALPTLEAQRQAAEAVADVLDLDRNPSFGPVDWPARFAEAAGALTAAAELDGPETLDDLFDARRALLAATRRAVETVPAIADQLEALARAVAPAEVAKYMDGPSGAPAPARTAVVIAPPVAFTIPPNPVVRSLRLRTQVNLDKIHRGFNAAGIERPLYLRDTSLTFSGPQGAAVRFQPTAYRAAVLLERARQHASLAQQAEAAFLSALEHYEAEEYAALQARQQLDLTQAGVRLQDLRVRESIDGERLATAQIARSAFQRDHFASLYTRGTSESERMSMDFLSRSMSSQRTNINALGDAGFLGVASSIFGTAAQMIANPALAPLAFIGGILGGIGNTAQTRAQQASARAQLQQAQSSFYAQQASYERRAEEWAFQEALANQDITVGRVGLTLARDRTAITRMERDIALLQANHAAETVVFLATKFTSAELYLWMSGVLEEVFAFYLQLATATAHLALDQLSFERQAAPPPLIAVDYFDAPGSGGEDRRGLTGSARLMADLTRLDQYAFETDQRKLQLVRTVSLAQHDPVAFARFRETGVLPFALPQETFDREFPGHYLRLLRSASVTVVGLIPPVQGIRATLAASGTSTVVVDEEGVFRPVRVQRNPDEVALSSPYAATGVFQLDAEGQARLLPFEGGGVDTRWEFQLPIPANPFDFGSIADVMVTVEYTALSSDTYRREVIGRLDPVVSAERPFSLRDDFADAWYDLLNPGLGEDGEGLAPSAPPVPVTFTTRREDFPPHLADLRIEHVMLYAVRGPGKTNEVEEVKLVVNPGAVASSTGAVTLFNEKDTRGGLLSSRRDSTGWSGLDVPTTGGGALTWSLTLDNDARALLEDETVEDLLLVLVFEGVSPPWPL